MDAKTHMLFGVWLCEKFGFDIGYAVWSTAPDIDHMFLHRYWRHRSSSLPQLYKEFSRLHPELSNDDKIAIATQICGHFLLDIYNSWLFCWGFYFPAAHIPNEVIKEYLEDLKLQGDEEFYNRQRELFDEIIVEEPEHFMCAVIFLLRDHTFFCSLSRAKRAIDTLSKFCGKEILCKTCAVHRIRKFDKLYFDFLNEYFARR